MRRLYLMPKETMSSRERWAAVLSRQSPDRVPMDYWATPEATSKLLRHLGCTLDEMLLRLHIDQPIPVGGRYVGPPPREGEDAWGIRRTLVDYGTGTYEEAVSHPLASYGSVEAIATSYPWPVPDYWDYSHLPDLIEGQEHRPVMTWEVEPFLTYKELRGDEQAFVDLAQNPEIVEYCMDKLTELECENVQRIFETIPGQVLLVDVSEDMGAQTGLMYSPEQIRRFFGPRLRKKIALVKQAGAYVFHHNDGSIREILPELVEWGIDVLNPVQWRCVGMDRESLKRDFRDKLIFHGGMDNQHTLPHGTVDEVRQEVLDNYRILGEGGGYVLAPCHNIQAVGPAENVVAMYEAGYEYGWT